MPRIAPRASFVLCAFALLAAISAPTQAATSPSGSGRTRHALDQVLPQLKFDGVTLGDALAFIQDVTNSNMHVNWRALEAIGVSKDATVNVRVRSVSLRKALTLVLSETGNGEVTFYVADGVIEVTTKELADKDLITRVYPVDDLIMEVPDFTDAPTFDLNQQQGGGTAGGGGRGGGGGGGGGQSLFGSGGNGGGNSNGQTQGMTRDQRAEQLIDLITTIIRPEIWQVNGGTAGIRFFNGALVVTAPRSVHEALAAPVD